MQKKLLIVIGVGLVAATASTYLFYQFLSESAESKNRGIEIRHSIVVAARDLERGTQLDPDDLAVAPWAGENLPAWALSEPTALVGKILSYDVSRQEPLMDSRFSISGRGGAAGRIPPGMRAVSVNVSEYSGVNFLFQPGDRVDVMVSNGPPLGRKLKAPRQDHPAEHRSLGDGPRAGQRRQAKRPSGGDSFGECRRCRGS